MRGGVFVLWFFFFFQLTCAFHRVGFDNGMGRGEKGRELGVGSRQVVCGGDGIWDIG